MHLIHWPTSPLECQITHLKPHRIHTSNGISLGHPLVVKQFKQMQGSSQTEVPGQTCESIKKKIKLLHSGRVYKVSWFAPLPTFLKHIWAGCLILSHHIASTYSTCGGKRLNRVEPRNHNSEGAGRHCQGSGET